MARTALLLLLGAAAIGTDPGAPSLTFENRSQYELVELRVHEGPSYRDAANVLGAPLPIGGTMELDAEGPAYATFFREKYRHGPILAFTMPEPIEVRAGERYRVTMFDESFRVVRESPAAADESGCACTH